MFGSDPALNSTSTTGPMTCLTFPVGSALCSSVMSVFPACALSPFRSRFWVPRRERIARHEKIRRNQNLAARAS